MSHALRYLLLVCLAVTLPLDAAEPAAWRDYGTSLRVPLNPRQREVILNKQAVNLASLRKDPADTQARLTVGYTLLHLEKYHQAAEWFFEVLTRDDHHAEAALRFAECLYLSGDEAGALRAIGALDKAKITDPILPALVAEVAFKRKAYAVCANRLERAIVNLRGTAHPESPMADYLAHNLQVVKALMDPIPTRP